MAIQSLLEPLPAALANKDMPAHQVLLVMMEPTERMVNMEMLDHPDPMAPFFPRLKPQPCA